MSNSTARSRLPIAAVLLVLAYIALGLSLVVRNAVLLAIVIPAGAFLILVAIVIWLAMVIREARSKGMV